MKLNHELIATLIAEGKSCKEVIEITGYNKNSVYGWCLRHYGKLEDVQKSRRQCLEITQDQKEYLFGTLLGDGNLVLSGKNKTTVGGRTNHSLTQIDYCIHKQKLLTPLTSKVSTTIKQLNGKLYPQCYFCMKNNTSLLEMYHTFYKNGKKDVPLDLSLLTPKAMAWWFMDDGTSTGKCSISIATCSFSIEGLLRLQKYLKETYDLDIVIQKDFKIYFKAASAEKFYDLVKEYIIPSMIYKFKYLN